MSDRFCNPNLNRHKGAPRRMVRRAPQRRAGRKALTLPPTGPSVARPSQFGRIGVACLGRVSDGTTDFTHSFLPIWA